VSYICPPAELDRTLAAVLDRCRAASPTATAHTKRLLHESFHHDPRVMIEELIRLQDDCMTSWELTEANRAWQEKREARFFPPPARSAE
jgi:enoyl-CoA hydratase/carnithine racemase